MGYDLMAKNKSVDPKIGMIITWPMMLNETGACYLLGYGDISFKAGHYIYDGSRNDGSPVSNDGFEVSKEEAMIMARLFRGYVKVKREILKEWEAMTEEEKKVIRSIMGEHVVPPGSDFINKVEEMADFLENSDGFNIY